MEVRRLRVGEGARLRELRLRALADAPAAFGATLAHDAARPASDWEALAGGPGAVFVAVAGDQWLGMAGVQPSDGAGAGHGAGGDGPAAILWGTWVAPEARGRGVGRRLTEAVIAWTRIRALGRLALSVSDAAPAARALYTALGFAPTGEARPLPSHPSIAAPELALALDPPSRTLETERLLLRPFTLEDVPALATIQSRADVARYLYWEPRAEPEVREWLAGRIPRTGFLLDGDALGFALVRRDSGELIGDCSLQLVSARHHQGEIGYLVHPAHHGHGFATEAARALVGLGFAGFGLHRIVGRLEARNAASARVLERLGMRREAHLVENELVKGEWQSEVVYAILAADWPG